VHGLVIGRIPTGFSAVGADPRLDEEDESPFVGLLQVEAA
jgi:hypothetical protein